MLPGLPIHAPRPDALYAVALWTGLSSGFTEGSGYLCTLYCGNPNPSANVDIARREWATACQWNSDRCWRTRKNGPVAGLGRTRRRLTGCTVCTEGRKLRLSRPHGFSALGWNAP